MDPIVDEIKELEITKLETPEYILRPLNTEVVAELARSIGGIGLLQPLLVRNTGKSYEVVFGNHRLEACKSLGMTSLPVVVRTLNDDEAFLARLAENLLRNSFVNPIEEAEGYKMLMSKGWSINAIGRKIGKCDSYVCERLALLERLTQNIRTRMIEGKSKLSPSHAELISRIDDQKMQEKVAADVEKRKLSVRSLEDIISGVPMPTKVQIGWSDGYYIPIPKNYAEALNLARGSSVAIKMRGKKLVVDHANDRRTHKKSKNSVKKLIGESIR